MTLAPAEVKPTLGTPDLVRVRLFPRWLGPATLCAAVIAIPLAATLQLFPGIVALVSLLGVLLAFFLSGLKHAEVLSDGIRVHGGRLRPWSELRSVRARGGFRRPRSRELRLRFQRGRALSVELDDDRMGAIERVIARAGEALVAGALDQQERERGFRAGPLHIRKTELFQETRSFTAPIETLGHAFVRIDERYSRFIVPNAEGKPLFDLPLSEVTDFPAAIFLIDRALAGRSGRGRPDASPLLVAAPRRSARRLGDRVWLGVFGLLGIAVGAGVLIHSGAELRSGLASAGWRETAGEIISARIVSDSSSKGRSRERGEITYEFFILGERYVSTQVRASGTTLDDVDRYAPGTRVRVHYDPDDPKDALLEPGMTGAAVLQLLFGALLAAFYVGWLVLSLKKPKKTNDA